jgi:hypothetical protein
VEKVKEKVLKKIGFPKTLTSGIGLIGKDDCFSLQKGAGHEDG